MFLDILTVHVHACLVLVMCCCSARCIATLTFLHAYHTISRVYYCGSWGHGVLVTAM